MEGRPPARRHSDRLTAASSELVELSRRPSFRVHGAPYEAQDGVLKSRCFSRRSAGEKSFVVLSVGVAGGELKALAVERRALGFKDCLEEAAVFDAGGADYFCRRDRR